MPKSTQSSPRGRDRKSAPANYDMGAFSKSPIMAELLSKPAPTGFRARPGDSISAGPRSKGVLTGALSRTVQSGLKAAGVSEKTAARSAQAFEDANLDYNPLSSADMVGTQARRLAAGDKDASVGSLAYGAANLALPLAGKAVKPVLGALSKTGIGKAALRAFENAKPTALVDDGIIEATASARRVTDRAKPLRDVKAANGATITPRMAQPGALSSPGKIAPVGPVEYQDLQHFSHHPNIKATDPAFKGSNPAAITSREEQQSSVNQTYFGIDTGKYGGYRREAGAGPFEYSATIPSHRLVKTGSPEMRGLQKAAKQIMVEKDTRFGPYGPNGQKLMSNLAKGSGYAGMQFEPEMSELGRIAQVYEKVPVSRVTPTIPSDFLPKNLDNVMTRDDWAIATGANPMGEQAPEVINALRNSRLDDRAERMGAKTYPVKGKYFGTEEDSRLIAPISQDQAVALGTAFDQDSVLTHRGFLMHDGQLVPATGATAFQPRQAPADNYSRIATGSRLARIAPEANFRIDFPEDFDAAKVPDPTRHPMFPKRK